MDLAKVVSTKRSYQWNEGSLWQPENRPVMRAHQRLHVVACDYGVKRNILRMLASRGCAVTVVPAQTRAADVLKLAPDGVFLSNGPGDPEPCDYAIATTRDLIERGIPTFGICLGHQIMALASGAKSNFYIDCKQTVLTAEGHFLVGGLFVQALCIATYLAVAQLGEFYALSVMFGLAYGGVMPLYAVLVREFFGARIMGATFGGVAFLSTLGMALGPWAGGWLYDVFGSYFWLYIGSFGIGTGPQRSCPIERSCSPRQGAVFQCGSAVLAKRGVCFTEGRMR